jgi:hypothetical protein
MNICHDLGECVCVRERERERERYTATIDLHNSQIISANTESSAARTVFSIRFLVTDVNTGDYYASRAHALLSTDNSTITPSISATLAELN